MKKYPSPEITREGMERVIKKYNMDMFPIWWYGKYFRKTPECEDKAGCAFKKMIGDLERNSEKSRKHFISYKNYNLLPEKK